MFDAYYSGLPGNSGLLFGAASFGWHAECGLHVLRLALSGALERHPGLNIVVGHMGEMLPFMLDRLDHTALDIARLDVSPSKIILERVYITTSGLFSTPDLLNALAKFGADRILFSIDHPYSLIAIARRWLDTIPVAPADRQKIIHGNADRLLNLSVS